MRKVEDGDKRLCRSRLIKEWFSKLWKEKFKGKDRFERNDDSVETGDRQVL